MEWKLSPKMNSNLYLRNPEETELGKKIIAHGAKLISELGFEAFTFKKLSESIGSTEATIYRYFENKHKLLIYIVDWYWYWLDYQVVFHTNNINSPKQKLEIVIGILTAQTNTEQGDHYISKNHLQKIIITDSSKTYLNQNVTELNKIQLFKPYKDLCARIATLITEYNPQYKFPKSLSSSLIEMAHFQEFFMQHLPSLTDFGAQKDLKNVQQFLNSLIFGSLAK